jgi:hypothetical protein
MIGISFAYPDAADKFRHPPWTELRCARIEPGPPNVVWGKGESREIDYYWRNWNIPLEERTRLMSDIVQGLVESHKVDGFTLWWNWDKKNWQMNVRREGQAWSVNYISQSEAVRIFSTLEAAHPDGPWSVKDYVQNDAAAKAEIEKRPETPAAKAERQIEDLFDSTLERTDTWPYAKRRELPLDEALRRCAAAVERGTALLAAYLPADG